MTTRRRGRAAFLTFLAVIGLLLAAAPPGSATRTYTRWARSRATVFERVAVTAAATATASVTATVAGFSASAKATERRSAKASAGAWADAGARVRATATRGSTATARARALARSLAHQRAVNRARSRARQRAYADARTSAYRQAIAAARSAAASRARIAATAKVTAPGGPECAGPAIAKASGGYWICTFDDEFDGSALDTSKWLPITTAASSTTGGGACFVDSPDNIAESGGYLTLTARQEAAPFSCTSPVGSTVTSYTAGPPHR